MIFLNLSFIYESRMVIINITAHISPIIFNTLMVVGLLIWSNLLQLF